MTAQNLDIYETFQARGVSFTRLCKISNLALANNGKQKLPKVDQHDRYPVDALSKKPLCHELRAALRSVLLSVGSIALASPLPRSTGAKEAADL